MQLHSDTSKNPQTYRVRIQGMHCASCEVLIERKFKKVPGVERVSVSRAREHATLVCSQKPSLEELQQSVKQDGYTVQWWDTIPARTTAGNTRRDYFEIGGIVLILTAVYVVLRRFDLVPETPAISANMGYGVVFIIGLVAAMSTCIAVTGGLLMAVAATYNERNPHLSGAQRFRPHLFFNLGRIVSYTVLGGAIGALGSVVTLSPFANGVLTILASLVMLLLGFQLLRLFPRLGRFQPRMPKFLSHRIHDLSTSQSGWAAFLLGGGTFFLPCGFTQALQLYVLSQGDALSGALTMLVFSLGTLPALMSLSAISSFARGSFQRYFLKFAGVLVLVVGVFSIRNGFNLTGISASLSRIAARSERVEAQVTAAPQAAPIIDGVQVVEMAVDGLSYRPNTFSVVAGVPVEWRVDGRNATGCARVITAPSIGLTEYLPADSVKTITFTPEKAGTIPFSCSMGMTTPGSAFTVLASTTATAVPQTKLERRPTAEVLGPTLPPQAIDAPALVEPVLPKAPEVNVQKVNLGVTSERGFYPERIKVKKGIPVELTVDVAVDLGGCMSTMVIPEYDVSQYLTYGSNTITFTPEQVGSITATCPMGIPMVTFDVE